MKRADPPFGSAVGASASPPGKRPNGAFWVVLLLVLDPDVGFEVDTFVGVAVEV